MLPTIADPAPLDTLPFSVQVLLPVLTEVIVYQPAVKLVPLAMCRQFPTSPETTV